MTLVFNYWRICASKLFCGIANSFINRLCFNAIELIDFVILRLTNPDFANVQLEASKRICLTVYLYLSDINTTFSYHSLISAK